MGLQIILGGDTPDHRRHSGSKSRDVFVSLRKCIEITDPPRDTSISFHISDERPEEIEIVVSRDDGGDDIQSYFIPIGLFRSIPALLTGIK